MIQAGLNWHSYTFTHPALNHEPSWKDKVSRWSQLDAPSYGLAEAFINWRPNLKRPELIVLASPGASTETDRKFARTGASSPSLFVHTLPNIRCSPLLQVMEWSGPVLCIQKDPFTIVTGLSEAVSFLNGSFQTVWVLSVMQENGTNVVHGFELSSDGIGDFELHESKDSADACEDKSWLHWLERPLVPIFLSGNIMARRRKQ